MTTDEGLGYIESSQRLVSPGGRQWSQTDLLRAAEAGELRNTGWPIGRVSQREELKPVSTPDGIEARLGRYELGWEDYWAFRKDCSYYVVRLFEENFESPNFFTSQGHPEKSLWFDIRIWRIAEVILHSSTIYRELGIPPDEPYLLLVNHGGLSGREFYASSARAIHRGRMSNTPKVNWTKEVTQDYVTSHLNTLVREVASDLFIVFDFMQIEDRIVDGMVNDFLERGR